MGIYFSMLFIFVYFYSLYLKYRYGLLKSREIERGNSSNILEYGSKERC